MKKVTVFGGSRNQPGDHDYTQALLLGQYLGEAGYAVITGGYIGSMEAVSRGAAESGGLVIGVTCDEIEHWRPVYPNRWVQEERRFPTLIQRLIALIDICDAAIALPGGPGTLAEVSTMWSQLLTGVITPRPLILIGMGWSQTFETFYSNFDPYIPSEQRQWIVFAENIKNAVNLLKEKI